MTTVALALLRKFWPYILGVLLVVAALVWWNGYVASVESKGYDKAVAESTARELAQARANQQAFAKLIADRDKQAAALTAANDKALKKLGEAQNETNRLRNVDSYGLRVRALCPNSGQSAQGATNASLDTGTGAELDSVARQDYNALRKGIDRTEAKLAACQAELILRQPLDQGNHE